MTNNLINYSELATMARCETQWGYAYLLKQDEAPDTNKRGLHRGTLIHLWADQWLQGNGATLPEEWTDDINTGGKPGEVRTLSLADFDAEDVALARWLAARYEEHYGSVPPADWSVVSSEEWLQCTVDGIHIVGRTDGLIEIDGDLWLREVKSAANIKQRLLTVGVEPQPSVYYALVEANYGRPPVGILFDGVNTYRWKAAVPSQKALIEARIELEHTDSMASIQGVEIVTTHGLHIRKSVTSMTGKQRTEWARAEVENHPGVERPAADSFERAWPDRSPEQIDIGIAQLKAVVARREALTPRVMPYPKDLALYDTIPNIGTQTCNSCGFKARCWARLTGLDESDIELDLEDDAEPV